MNKGKLALRLIYAVGLAALWVADWIGDNQPAPHWFAEAVSESTLYVAITTAALWIVLEILLHFVRHRGIWATALAVSIIAVAAPAFYVTSAALYGASQADINTWHLLPLFAVMYQVYAMVAAMLIAAGLALIFWIARTAARHVEARRAQDS